MTLQRFCFRFAMVLVSVLVALGAILALTPKYRQTLFLRAERERLANECAQLELMIDQLHRHQQRFQTDPDFVEQIARQNRRVRPDEVVFVVEPRSDPDAPDAP